MSQSTYFTNKIVFLNVILTIMIVLIHSNPLPRYGIEQSFDYPIIYIVDKLTIVAVPLFFFISAYLFYRNCDWGNLKDKLKKRI